MPKNPKVAGQIFIVGGERAFLLDETLADVCDLSNWEIVEDTVPKVTPEEEAERRVKLEAWERRQHEGQPTEAHRLTLPPQSLAVVGLARSTDLLMPAGEHCSFAGS